ncbi:hypothetical protein [Methanohalophilus profundi]|uniref:hypothetical protein n=1 Tax=Methanohalophilus profundi TaxID=2138083 RepID=UPI002989B509|nr:hypothetical protein [Methanohalophilus profundi]
MKELKLDEPYSIPYRAIYAICDETDECAEIIEHSNCYGGAAWARHHYSHSPIVRQVRTLGNMTRYLVKTGKVPLELKPSSAAAGIEAVEVKDNEVAITYAGLGGGGVGATRCRAQAAGVVRSETTPSGGGKAAKGTIVVPKRKRVLIGIDDTDTKETGATWCLTHNIAKELDCVESVYLSHSLVQLFPVSAKPRTVFQQSWNLDVWMRGHRMHYLKIFAVHWKSTVYQRIQEWLSLTPLMLPVLRNTVNCAGLLS